MALMRQMIPGDSILIANGPVNTADVSAQAIACKIGGRWHTRRVAMIDDDRVIRGVILTCVEPPRPAGKRGRKKKT